jgi:hypothetical protein
MITHGNTIVEVISCGVHPLHDVQVRANGSRAGCPMCERSIEAIGRAIGRRKDAKR